MPPLPRATCPVCRADVALRKGDLLREHRDRRHPLYATGRSDEVPVCEGSGQLAPRNADERIERRGDNVLVLRESATLGVMLTRETDGRLIVSLPDGPHPFDMVNVLLDSAQNDAAVAFLRGPG